MIRLRKGSPLIEYSVIDQSLVDYVLPLLPKTPTQLKVNVPTYCYRELDLRQGIVNKCKEHVEVKGTVRVSYRFYPNGIVVVFAESSNNPFRLEDEVDRSRLIAFLGS